MPSTLNFRTRLTAIVFAAGVIALALWRTALLPQAASMSGLAAHAPSIALGLWTLALVVVLKRMGLSFWSWRTLLHYKQINRRTVGLTLLFAIAYALYIFLVRPILRTQFSPAQSLSEFSAWDLFLFPGLASALLFSGLLLKALWYGFGDTQRAAIFAVLKNAVLYALCNGHLSGAGMMDAAVLAAGFGGMMILARGSIFPPLFFFVFGFILAHVFLILGRATP